MDSQYYGDGDQDDGDFDNLSDSSFRSFQDYYAPYKGQFQENTNTLKIQING